MQHQQHQGVPLHPAQDLGLLAVHLRPNQPSPLWPFSSTNTTTNTSTPTRTNTLLLSCPHLLRHLHCLTSTQARWRVSTDTLSSLSIQPLCQECRLFYPRLDHLAHCKGPFSPRVPVQKWQLALGLCLTACNPKTQGNQGSGVPCMSVWPG